MPESIIHTVSPSTNEVVFETPSTSIDEARAIAKVSHNAFVEFSTLPFAERRAIIVRALDLIQQRKHDLGRELSVQMGRPITYSYKEIETMQLRAKFLLDISEEALSDIPGREEGGFRRFIRKVPVGPVLIVSAWNVGSPGEV